MTTLVQDLLAEGYELRETHISQVFLGRERVYKIKKPVALGFLDFSSLELRERYCRQELALNQRLAPDVYLGVVPITRDASGQHRIAGEGPPVEWAVEMCRLSDRDAADVRLREGRLGRPALRRLAERIARFHESARCDDETGRFGRPEVIAENVRENFEQTRQSAQRFLSAGELARLEVWQREFLEQHRDALVQRIARGRVRDGHGDLRLEHCYLDDEGGVRVIDCIEFNERFRFGDVCADIAFLAMDLQWHGEHGASERFLADYARASGDYDLYALVDFYESYRAFVRGKVGSILEADESADGATRKRAAEQVRKYYLLAEACSREPVDEPVLIAIGGLIASGKSTMADEIADRIAAPVVDSDRTRKQLAGVASHTPLSDGAFAGHYSADATAATYAELWRRAEVVLRSQRSVIVDASFRAASDRLAARDLAQRCGASFLFVECVAPEPIIRDRLRQRATAPSISDGRLDIFDAFMRSYEAVLELPAEAHVRLDTSKEASAGIERVLASIAR